MKLICIMVEMLSVRYSDVKGGYPGDGNIDADPFFVDPVYNLADSSLCIGAGIDSIEINWNLVLCTFV